MHISSALCNIVVLLSSTFVTNNFHVGKTQSEGILGCHPNVLCQIFPSLGHSIDACPNCNQPHQSFVASTYVIFTPVDASGQIWYPYSVVPSHMTLDEGKLLCKSP